MTGDEDSLLHPAVAEALAAYGVEHETLACSADLADTAAFCAHYGFALDDSANAILVASRKVEPTRYALCVALATTRVDVNRAVCGLLEVKRASFADADSTVAVTGMQIGGVSPPGVSGLPVYVDSAVMARDRVVIGGGNRTSKVLLAPGELLKLPGVSVVQGLAAPRPAA